MAREYHTARIGVNHAVRDDLNMRTFELASLGVPQLCDSRMVGLEECGFEPFVHYLPYASAEEAVEVVRKYVADSELWMMAENAKTLVRAQHTYVHRAKQMLADLEALVG
jgi:spore maturation protein CgeB